MAIRIPTANPIDQAIEVLDQMEVVLNELSSLAND